MTAGWVAATIRGRALLRSSMGVPTARRISSAATWEEARRDLGSTVFGSGVFGRGLGGEEDRASARANAGASTVWQLRVLAGWVPPTDTALVRVAAGPIEIGNIEQHLARCAGGAQVAPAVSMGSLGIAWPRAGHADSAVAVRQVLRRSAWGDPGGDAPAEVALGLRVAWLRRVLRADPATRPWVLGALAVMVARERFAFDRDISPMTRRELVRFLPRDVPTSDSLAALVARLPDVASWPFDDVDAADELWRAEAAVLRRVAGDADRRVATARAGRSTFTAILASLLVDLWRVQAAIELAGHGDLGREVFDAVAA